MDVPLRFGSEKSAVKTEESFRFVCVRTSRISNGALDSRRVRSVIQREQ